jgi:hypothetical protein
MICRPGARSSAAAWFSVSGVSDMGVSFMSGDHKPFFAQEKLKMR